MNKYTGFAPMAPNGTSEVPFLRRLFSGIILSLFLIFGVFLQSEEATDAIVWQQLKWAMSP